MKMIKKSQKKLNPDKKHLCAKKTTTRLVIRRPP